MGKFVIACYHPKPGKDEELLALTREHVPILRDEGLATERPAYAMRAKDGTVVEVFEWKSDEAIESAHTNPEVIKLWERYAAACDYVSLSSLAEAKDMFAGFEPIF
jgi:quinol monooxygenase YgiN